MVPVELPRIMGHRGAAAEAPENTLTSVRRVADCGATWVELDVMLTGDDVPVLFHDDSLKRTTGQAGLMAETTFDVVRHLDAGRWFGPAFEGEPLPSLEDTLALIRELGIGLNLEIKPSKGRARVTAERAMDIVARHWPQGGPPLLVSSFETVCLAVAQARRPDLPRGLITLWPSAQQLQLLAGLACASYHCYHKRLRAKTAAAVKAAGYALACFTVNDASEAQRLFDMGVDCVITDDPRRLLQTFGQNPL